MKKEFVPKTEFVKRLLFLRKRAISKGMRLLTLDEISKQKEQRRSGAVNQ